MLADTVLFTRMSAAALKSYRTEFWNLHWLSSTDKKINFLGVDFRLKYPVLVSISFLNNYGWQCFDYTLHIVIIKNNQCGAHLGAALFNIFRSQMRRLFECGAHSGAAIRKRLTDVQVFYTDFPIPIIRVYFIFMKTLELHKWYNPDISYKWYSL